MMVEVFAVEVTARLDWLKLTRRRGRLSNTNVIEGFEEAGGEWIFSQCVLSLETKDAACRHGLKFAHLSFFLRDRYG